MRAEVVEVVGGRWMVLVNGYQVGGNIDKSGAGDLTFETRKEASEYMFKLVYGEGGK